MPDDSLIDKDGVIYEKGWDGQYHPKYGLFGPERDIGWSRGEVARDWFGGPIRSSNGKTLYRRYGSSFSGDVEAVFVFYLMLLILGLAIIGIAIIVTPILAPIFLSSAASAEKSGDLAKAKKLRMWGGVASVVAMMFVLGVATLIGFFIFSKITSFVQSTTPLIVAGLVHLIAAGMGIVAAIMLGITGLAPTAIVYLRQKERQLRSSGKSQSAVRMRQLAWGFGIIAAGTVGMAILALGVLMVGKTIAPLIGM